MLDNIQIYIANETSKQEGQRIAQLIAGVLRQENYACQIVENRAGMPASSTVIPIRKQNVEILLGEIAPVQEESRKTPPLPNGVVASNKIYCDWKYVNRT